MDLDPQPVASGRTGTFERPREVQPHPAVALVTRLAFRVPGAQPGLRYSRGQLRVPWMFALAGFSALLALLLDRPREVPVRVPPPAPTQRFRLPGGCPDTSLDSVRLGRALRLPVEASSPPIEHPSQRSQLPIHLLKTRVAPGYESALFRLPNGTDYEVSPLGEVFGAIVLGIKPGEVTLLEGGRFTTLGLEVPTQVRTMHLER